MLVGWFIRLSLEYSLLFNIMRRGNWLQGYNRAHKICIKTKPKNQQLCRRRRGWWWRDFVSTRAVVVVVDLSSLSLVYGRQNKTILFPFGQ
jgi:hypothetical protein